MLNAKDYLRFKRLPAATSPIPTTSITPIAISNISGLEVAAALGVTGDVLVTNLVGVMVGEGAGVRVGRRVAVGARVGVGVSVGVAVGSGPLILIFCPG